MELKVGSVVRIRSDLEHYGEYGNYFVAPSMYDARGTEAIVDKIVIANKVCHLQGFGDNLYFPIQMFSHVDGVEVAHEEAVNGVCPICGNTLRGGQTICSECETKARDIVTSYHSFRGYSIKSVGGEDKFDSSTIGAELEVEVKDGHRAGVTALYCKSQDSKNIIHFERDGSLSNGFEIITQPMTFKYWQEVYSNDLQKILKKASENGGKSHDTSTCGLHFHVGREGLATSVRSSDDVIDNVLLIVETFRKEIERFARRSSNRYARFLSEGSSVDSNELDLDTVKQLKSDKRGDRYLVVNLRNANTIEFRIFRGTLKFETFMASLELVNNIVNIAKYENIQGLTWLDLVNYNSEMNKYLTQYNETLDISSNKEVNVLSFYEVNKGLFSLGKFMEGKFELRLGSHNNNIKLVASGRLVQLLLDKGVDMGCNFQDLVSRILHYDYLSVQNGQISIYDGARFRGNGASKKKIDLVKLVELYDKYSELLED